MLNRLSLALVMFVSLGGFACGDLHPLTPPMTFTLENGLTHSTFYNLGPCNTTAWVSIQAGEGQLIELASAQGGACSGYCGESETLCSEAAIDCIPASAKELAPSAHVSFAWDGVEGRYDANARC